MFIDFIIYFIFAIYSRRSLISAMQRVLKVRWEKVVDMNNVDYDIENITSMQSLRQISADTHIKDIYVRLLARRLYLHRVVINGVMAAYAIMLLLNIIFIFSL